MEAAIERTKAKLMDWGLHTPGKRMLVGAAIGAAVIWAFQPSSMFEHGRPRPFSAWSPPEVRPGEIVPTTTPWWIVPLTGAFVFGMLV